MATSLDSIPELIAEGEKFTFDNFAHNSALGYPAALAEDWLVWTHRVGEVLTELEMSPISQAIEAGLKTRLLGNGEDKFERAHKSILSGLKAAQKIYGVSASPLGPSGLATIGLLDGGPIVQPPSVIFEPGIAAGIKIDPQISIPSTAPTSQFESLAVELHAGGEDRPEALFETLVARVAILEAAVQELRELREIGIGHNRPPAGMETFLPATSEDLNDIDEFIALLKEQPAVPAIVPPQLIEKGRRVSKVGAKIAELADMAAKEAVKAAGHEAGKRLVQLPLWLSIAGAISGVAVALQNWIAVVPH